MSSFDAQPQQTQQGKAESVQPGTQAAQAPLQVGQSPSTGTVPGLPPTALSMQMQSLNQQYAERQQQQQGMQAMGAGLQTGGPLMMDGPGGPRGDLGTGEFGRTSLADMAERLAQSYGLNFGKGSLVDAEGNFMVTPEQLAGQNEGADMASIAEQMNQISSAMNDRRIDQQQNKATAALQAGLGQVQQRGRGSLAGMQSNFYQQMARNYTDPNLLPEQQDFSFWIQKGQLDEEEQALNGGGTPLGGGGGGGGGGGASHGGAPVVTQRNLGNTNPYNPRISPEATDTGPQGKGDVVTTGPNAGKRPVYTYDPIGKTTTVSWESA